MEIPEYNPILAKFKQMTDPRWKKDVMDENDFYDDHEDEDEDEDANEDQIACLSIEDVFAVLRDKIIAQNTVSKAQDATAQTDRIIHSLERIGRAQAVLQRILNDNVFSYLQARAAEDAQSGYARDSISKDIGEMNKKMGVLRDDLWDLYSVLKGN